jgi:hypothetical protein
MLHIVPPIAIVGSVLSYPQVQEIVRSLVATEHGAEPNIWDMCFQKR